VSDAKTELEVFLPASRAIQGLRAIFAIGNLSYENTIFIIYETNNEIKSSSSRIVVRPLQQFAV